MFDSFEERALVYYDNNTVLLKNNSRPLQSELNNSNWRVVCGQPLVRCNRLWRQFHERRNLVFCKNKQRVCTYRRRSLNDAATRFDRPEKALKTFSLSETVRRFSFREATSKRGTAALRRSTRIQTRIIQTNERLRSNFGSFENSHFANETCSASRPKTNPRRRRCTTDRFLKAYTSR